jgi:hypothetical protein
MTKFKSNISSRKKSLQDVSIKKENEKHQSLALQSDTLYVPVFLFKHKQALFNQ